MINPPLGLRNFLYWIVVRIDMFLFCWWLCNYLVETVMGVTALATANQKARIAALEEVGPL